MKGKRSAGYGPEGDFPGKVWEKHEKKTDDGAAMCIADNVTSGVWKTGNG